MRARLNGPWASVGLPLRAGQPVQAMHPKRIADRYAGMLEVRAVADPSRARRSARASARSPQRHRQAAVAYLRTRALAHDRTGDSDRQIAGLVFAGFALQPRRRGQLGNALEQLFGRLNEGVGRTASIGRVIGEQLGAAIAQ